MWNSELRLIIIFQEIFASIDKNLEGALGSSLSFFEVLRFP